MLKPKDHSSQTKLFILIVFAIGAIVLYMTMNINWNFYQFAFSLRLPKLLAIFIAAGCIGICSLVFQTIIHNNIVTPCLLGLNALYIFVQTLIFFALGTNNIFSTQPLLAFLLNLTVMTALSFIIYGGFFKRANGNVLVIILTGSVLSTFFSSITTTLQRVMDPNDFLSMQTSLVPSFSNIKTNLIILAAILTVIVTIVFFKDMKQLNIIALGRNNAINLGVDYEKTVRRLLIATTLYIAIATALVGPISFLGLIVANLARQLLKTYRHSILIIGSCLTSIGILVLGQMLVEQVFNYNSNISVIISVGGGIYFLFLLLRNAKGNA